jgi:hypothetical protein
MRRKYTLSKNCNIYENIHKYNKNIMSQELINYAGCDCIIDNRGKIIFEDEEELLKAMNSKKVKKIVDWYFDNLFKCL